MVDYPFAFVPSTELQVRAGSYLWFAFRKRELLVTDEFTVPRLDTLERLGLTPVRAQFLGHLGQQGCVSAELPVDVAPPPGMQFLELRQLFGRLPEPLMAVAGRAIQTVEWDRLHQFCGSCGAPTRYHPTQRARVCSDRSCGGLFYPRLTPAIIVIVERGPEVLLARSPHFPPGIYSALAGFVEPGESVEDAVHREVFEETRVQIKNLRYFGSQPWPFPNSLMLGFHAEYAGGEIVPDPEEIEDAAFFHIDAMPKTFRGSVSISQWLLHDFLRRHGREPPA